jgi:oligopeptide transport system substrate-binding protein
MPKLRSALAVLAALALPFGAAACGADDSPYFGTDRRPPRSPTTFYVNATTEPVSIDPARTSEMVGTVFISHLYEGLSVYDPRDAHATQGVAMAWEKSDDNRLFRFHLRPEAVWSDGKRVTADDFVFAWSRTLSPALGASSAADLYVVLNAEPYSRGLLLVTRGAAPVREGASEGAAVKLTLAPGTAVRVLKKEGDYSLVAAHDRLPTFDPDRPAPVPDAKAPPPAPLGFVRTADLEQSPSVLGIRAVGDDVLEVEAEGPAPYFLDLTCAASLSPLRRDVVAPLDAAGKRDALNRPEGLIHNGAFTIDEWKFHYEITMSKNPTYWRARDMKIDRAVWMMVEDYRSTLNLYKAGELDYVGDNAALPPEILPFVSGKKDFVHSRLLGTYFYVFNVTKPPVDDVRVRRALNLAIDKQQLIDRVTRGKQIPATHYVPDYTGSGYAEQVEADRKAGKDPFSGAGFDFDPDRARALLREAGYEVVQEGLEFKARGFPPLELLYNTNEGNRAIAVAVQDFWRKNLGVTASLRNEEWKVMLKNLEEGNFQVARASWLAVYNHPETFLDLFLSYSPQNQTRWADPEFDSLVREAASTKDLADSIRKFRDAEKRAVDAMPRLPLYFYTRNTVVKPWVHGFYPNPRNMHQLQWLWIDEHASGENRPAFPPLEYAPPGRFVKSGGAPR